MGEAICLLKWPHHECSNNDVLSSFDLGVSDPFSIFPINICRVKGGDVRGSISAKKRPYHIVRVVVSTAKMKVIACENGGS
jgi:hypothetical protein